MNTNFIKVKLREGLLQKIFEADKTAKKKSSDKKDIDGSDVEPFSKDDDRSYDELSGKEQKRVDNLASFVERATEPGKGVVKLSQIMAKADLKDSKGNKRNPKKGSDRKAIDRKLDGEEYHLTPGEAASLVKVINNITAHL